MKLSEFFKQIKRQNLRVTLSATNWDEEFVEFVRRPEARAWLNAQVVREFPRLACGIIYVNAEGQLEAVALPNVSKTPTKKWEAGPLKWVELEIQLHAGGASSTWPVFGVFGSRAPNKPASAEEVRGWQDQHQLVISVSETGEPIDHQSFRFNAAGVPVPLTSDSSNGNGTQKVFAEQSRLIGASIQVVNDELMHWLVKHPEDLLRIHPGTFELIVAEIFRDQGYDVELLGSWNQPDGGIDIIAIRRDTLVGPFRIGIQCKRYVKTSIVKADFVWALEGRLDKFHLHKGVVATTARFEKSVLSELHTNLWRIELKDFERLTRDLESWGRYKKNSGGLWLPK